MSRRFPRRRPACSVGAPRPEVPLQVSDTPEALELSTGTLCLRIEKDPFRLSASGPDGRPCWQQRRNDLFTADIFDTAVAEHAGRSHAFESFALAAEEEIFGLGERFDHVARRGKAVDFWNKDAIGTSCPRTYINVPFLFSTRGYGLFLNSTAPHAMGDRHARGRRRWDSPSKTR